MAFIISPTLCTQAAMTKHKLRKSPVAAMTQSPNKRPAVLYATAVWMTLNIALMGLIILNGDAADLNNWIEIALWVTSIAGLLSMRKWGFAFAIFTLTYTLSTSVGILIYYQVWINAIRIIVNVPIIIYLFRTLFDSKFK
jgi:hypothetical protein